MSLLAFENVSKSYGATPALENVSLDIPAGKIVGLLGPNGSGKTTLSKLIYGLLQPDQGRVLINDMDPSPATKAIVAYLPDTTYLNEQMKVKEALTYFKTFYKDFNLERAHHLLADLGIDENSRLKKLSKGNKEKVQLILVMSRDARLYVLDEPIGGVDPAARDYILNTIINNYSPTSTVLISTHLISDIEPILDEIVFLKDGKVVRQGNVDDIRYESGESIDQLFRQEFKASAKEIIMFWNLVRYEFKNVNKWYLALYAAVLILSALIGIQAQTYNHLPVKESQPVLLIFLATVFGGLMITLGISTIFLIIKRFKGSVYDRQGYLTLTLPVSEHYIITAKLVGAFIWSIVSTAVLALSAFIVLTLTAPDWFATSDLIPFIETHLPQLSLMGVSFLLNTISGILCIYLAISIGQLFNEYRTALSIVAYIGIQIVVGFIELFYRSNPGFYFPSTTGGADQFQMGIIMTILEEVILIAIYYLGTYHILKNKVNLQ